MPCKCRQANRKEATTDSGFIWLHITPRQTGKKSKEFCSFPILVIVQGDFFYLVLILQQQQTRDAHSLCAETCFIWRGRTHCSSPGRCCCLLSSLAVPNYHPPQPPPETEPTRPGHAWQPQAKFHNLFFL